MNHSELAAALAAKENTVRDLDGRLEDAARKNDVDALRSLGAERSVVLCEADVLRPRICLLSDLAEAECLAVEDSAWEAEVEMLRDRLAELDRPADTGPLPGESCVLEVRAGVGGADAALFAAQLWSMYADWARRNGWEAEEAGASIGKDGLGVRNASLRVSGPGAYTRLAPEAGVHRIQRVPVTEARGRIHTSTATVAVLPEPEAGEGLLDWADIRTDTFHASGNGGQSVNTTDSAVRLTHGPTGTVATASTKSQHRNKEIAYGVLCARVAEAERQRGLAERAADRRQQIGDGSRSGRTRNYDIPEDVVVDYDTGTRHTGVARILAGDLSGIEAARGEARAR